MAASPTPTSQTRPAQEPGSRPSPSGPVPAVSTPEVPLAAAELALGAIGAAGAWWWRRRSGDDDGTDG